MKMMDDISYDCNTVVVMDCGEDLAITFEETTAAKLLTTKTATMAVLMKTVTVRKITAAAVVSFVSFEMAAMCSSTES